VNAGSVRISFFAAVVMLYFSAPGRAGPAAAQTSSPRRVELPEAAKLSDVEIQWQNGGGDGCASVAGCSHYTITVRGDGFVELEELPWGPTRPKPPVRRRSIEPEQVVELVNELFKARFLEALDRYDNVLVVIRKEDVLTFGIRGGVNLTLRIGSMAKTVRLGENPPVELRAFSERIWRMASP